MRNKSIYLTFAIVGALLVGLIQLGAVNAQGPQPQSPSALQGTAFTYQGQLKQNGAPVNGSCVFAFKLFDALSGGSQVGAITKPLTVTNSLFTTQLDFGDAQFRGNARWLDLTVNCGGGDVTLAPRQALTAAPYALGLWPGAWIEADAGIVGRDLLVVKQLTTTGFFNAIHADSSAPNGSGLWGTNGGGGNGVTGGSNTGTGVYGSATIGTGVKGASTSGAGVYGTSTNGPGVSGSAPVTGVYGTATNGGANYGVYGTTDSSTGYGVYGRNSNSGTAVSGITGGGIGVYGSSTTNYGVYGTSGDGFGVYGITTGASGTGVWGGSPPGASGTGVWGDNGNSNSNGYAGYFNGRVNISQDLTTNGLKVNANGTTLKKVEAGTATIGGNGSASAVFTVTFSSAFSSVPKIVMTARNDPLADVGDTFVVSTRRISTSQVVVNVLRVDTATGWGQSLKLDWFAWE